MEDPEDRNVVSSAGVAALEMPEEAQAWLADLAEEEKGDRLAQPYIEAAAVLSRFDPGSIMPVEEVAEDQRSDALIALLQRSRVLEGRPVRWQLRDEVRREALQHLASRPAMRGARNANPAPGVDPLQRALDRLIEIDTPPSLDGRSLEDLLGLEQASAWLSGILDGLPNPRQLISRIEIERLLAPMRALAGSDFQNREEELQILTDYVGLSFAADDARRHLSEPSAGRAAERPPLLIHGPGGIGKSTLLARFILMHADPSLPDPLPFVYLDFDRAQLDPKRPHTLLTEALQQIEVEFWEVAAMVGLLGRDAYESAAALESVDFAKSDYRRSERLMNRLARLLSLIARQNGHPPLLILDTFEEAEYQGESAVRVVWTMLEQLRQSYSQLRIVIVGRSPLSDELPKQPIELDGLDPETAVHFLVDRTRALEHGPLAQDDARAIVELVGTVPLSIGLAARVVLQEGLDGLRDVVGRRKLFKRIAAEQQQGLLYARILQHLHSDDPELEKLANPGLIVRRITPEVITEVLAGPCDLRLEDPGHADRLFQRLRNEVGLVDPYREPGALWHLAGVRRLMLPELRQSLGTRVAEIHKAAVAHYHGRDDLVSRAEELYHSLCLGKPRDTLERLWTTQLDSWLRSAVHDLEPQASIWLSRKLGIDVDRALIAQADLTDWEEDTLRIAKNYLTSKLFDEALKAIRKRPERSPGSPLYRLEVDVLILRRELEEARKVAEAGLLSAETAGNKALACELLIRLSAIDERLGFLEGAIRSAAEALSAAESLSDPLAELAALVALLRLHRKSGETGAEHAYAPLLLERMAGEEAASLRSRAKALVERSGVRSILRSRPALLRESAAELGADMGNLLGEAIEVLGIGPQDLLAFLEYAQTANVPLSETQRAHLEQLSHARSSRGQGKTIAALAPEFRDFFARRLAESAEDVLRQTRAPTAGNLELSGRKIAALTEAIITSFGPVDLQIIVSDVFDQDYGNIVPPGPFRIQVLKLIRVFHMQGRLQEFVSALARSRPNNVQLQGLASKIHG